MAPVAASDNLRRVVAIQHSPTWAHACFLPKPFSAPETMPCSLEAISKTGASSKTGQPAATTYIRLCVSVGDTLSSLGIAVRIPNDR